LSAAYPFYTSTIHRDTLCINMLVELIRLEYRILTIECLFFSFIDIVKLKSNGLTRLQFHRIGYIIILVLVLLNHQVFYSVVGIQLVT
jgi:hypothetical protein